MVLLSQPVKPNTSLHGIFGIDSPVNTSEIAGGSFSNINPLCHVRRGIPADVALKFILVYDRFDDANAVLDELEGLSGVESADIL